MRSKRPGKLRKVLLLLTGLALLALALTTVAIFRLFLVRDWERIAVTPGPPSASPGTYSVTRTIDGRQRHYLIHVPPGVAQAPLPLVIAMHGRGGSARTLDSITGLSAIADRETFLLAMPDGIDRQWADGRVGRTGVDDVAFLTALIDDVAAYLPVDRARVYATGISNGAFMASRLACEAADRIAAIAVVVGTASPDFAATCAAARPVPVIAFLSTKDPLVPYEGGSRRSWLSPITKPQPVAGADEFVGFWAERDGCAARDIRSLPDLNRRDNSTVVQTRYVQCEAGATVDFYRVDGAGHTWPGGRQYASPWLIGTTNRDIDASELIWRFFSVQTLTLRGG